MASVRMSGELKNKIFENFNNQIHKVYENNSGLQDYLMSIMESFYSVEERELMKDYMEMHERLFRFRYPKKAHEEFSPKKYFSTYNSPSDFNQITNIHFVINPDRPDEESLTFLTGDDWHISYKNRYDNQENAPSNNYLDGDSQLTLKLDEPIQFIQEHEQHNLWAAEDDINSYTNPIIISSDIDIDNIEKFAEGTLKINDSKEQIKHLLDSCTTLKRFLDAWPAGKDSVPQEYLDRMFAETKVSTPSNLPKFDPNAILPDEVKEEMNSTVLTSKLIGE